ncbi:MAG: hypothetical protein JWN14_2597 [Chthonomonadales bacterium]|nr:hypothetical protein [Chthonomonadales bacterium]
MGRPFLYIPAVTDTSETRQRMQSQIDALTKENADLRARLEKLEKK